MFEKSLQKVIIIGPAHPFRGGIATYNMRLAEEFQKKGFEVSIETFSLQYPNFLFPGKTQYSDSEAPRNLIINQSINSISPLNWIKVGNRLKNQNADLVIVRYWLPFMGPALGTICRRIKKNKQTKIICLADNIIPHETRIGDQQFTNYFMKSLDAVLAMTQSVLDDAKQFRPNIPTAISPHPIFDNYGEIASKSNACEQLNLDENINYLLFFGLIRDYKGLDILLNALRTKPLENLSFKLIIAGEFYSNKEKYIKQINDLGLNDQIILRDHFIADEAVAHYFNAASLVVQPYKTATQSGVTQIAYHFNKPMLVTNVGGLKEMIPDGKVGYVVEPNSDEIAAAIAHFFNNNMEEQFVEGIKAEKKKYSWEILVQAFENLYKKL